MGDDGAEGEAPRCVGCGRRVRTLFVQYSPGNIRLMKCDVCKAVADPYIECEFMGILCQFILMHIVLDAFRISVSKNNKADGDSSRSTLSTICNCSEVLGDALLGNIIFTAMLLLGVRYILKFSFDITRYRQILLAIIISSYFKLFLLTMMVWEFPSSAIFIVEAFVLSSNVVALRVVTRFPKAHCVGVCFMAHAAKHLTERWLMWTP
ncbi:hypothetical protein ACQJBY_046094 [Aegilops geniculata]|uniref:protein ARV 1 isoform X5 n=1 Tax=Triticum aestivum TaxID=4565 RepID=UPI00098A485C|nr:protein ARV 1-like isoform X5 [Triticum aestivum]